jgi:hypothetical protein
MAANDKTVDSERSVHKNGNGTPAIARAASLVTLLIKLGGLALAGNEALFVQPPRDSVVFGVAAFMMAGATGLDNIIDNFLGRKGRD